MAISSSLSFVALAIFAIAFVLIIFEPFEKSVIALMGGILMILTGVLTAQEAIAVIEFETILLLLGMMLLVHMASESGILSWLNVRIAEFTRGSPLAIFLLFSVITGVFSAFLDNVTTVILIVPLTIELLRGMGRDPKPYIFAEIIFSNIGGALTLVGDPPNIIIGGATGFSFLDFVLNLWIPISLTAVTFLAIMLFRKRKDFKSLSGSLIELHLAALLIEKIKHKFLKTTLHRGFVINVLIILSLTILGFFLQEVIHIPAFVMAFTGAVLLAIVSSRQIDIHHAFGSVEWSTLFFFAGLFIMVGAVEKTGILDVLSDWMVNSTDNLLYLALLILWISGIVSMILDNIPFVTVMIPVIFGIQTQMPGVDTEILWWSLSLGACLGGNGTLVGASANVVAGNLAQKHGVKVTFLEYTKFALPFTILSLVICSGYLYFVV